MSRSSDRSWISGAMKADSVQVSSTLRRAVGAFMHWCAACEEMHQLPDTWVFVDQNLEQPTFSPSFKHIHREGDREMVCHYVLTGGVLYYQDDCTHALAGQSVSLPELPPEMRDDNSADCAEPAN